MFFFELLKSKAQDDNYYHVIVTKDKVTITCKKVGIKLPCDQSAEFLPEDLKLG